MWFKILILNTFFIFVKDKFNIVTMKLIESR